MTAHHRTPLRFTWRSSALLALTSFVGLAGFTWPLFTQPSGTENLAHGADAPWLFVLLLPLLLAVLLAEIADGTVDAKAIAVLGVLVACGAVLRAPTTGVTGFTGVVFLLLPSRPGVGGGVRLVPGAPPVVAAAPTPRRG